MPTGRELIELVKGKSSAIALELIFKFGFGQDIGDRLLLILVVVLLLAAVQLFSFGLLGELLIRTYHESQGRPIYRVREIFSLKRDRD